MPTVPTTCTDIVGLEVHSVGNDSDAADNHADSSNYLY